MSLRGRSDIEKLLQAVAEIGVTGGMTAPNTSRSTCKGLDDHRGTDVSRRARRSPPLHGKRQEERIMQLRKRIFLPPGPAALLS
jgi:hypothetical protein